MTNIILMEGKRKMTKFSLSCVFLSGLAFIMLFGTVCHLTSCRIRKKLFGVSCWRSWTSQFTFIYFIFAAAVLLAAALDHVLVAFLIMLIGLFISHMAIVHNKINACSHYVLSSGGKEALLRILSKEEVRKKRKLKILDVCFIDKLKACYSNYEHLKDFRIIGIVPHKDVYWFTHIFRGLLGFRANSHVKILSRDTFQCPLKVPDIILVNVPAIPSNKLHELCNKIKRESVNGMVIALGKPLLGFRIRPVFAKSDVFVYEL